MNNEKGMKNELIKAFEALDLEKVTGCGNSCIYIDKNKDIYFHILENNPNTEKEDGAWFSFSLGVNGKFFFGKKAYNIMLDSSRNIGYIGRKTDIEAMCASKGKKLVDDSCYKINADYDLDEGYCFTELIAVIEDILQRH